MKGKLLEHMTWVEAEKAFKEIQVVLIPIGARCKEHGLHLPLNTDWIQAEYLRDRIIERINVLALPTMQYGYYPAFTEYPGSITIERDTFSSMIVEVCETLHKQGANRFYFLNTGISTNWSLEKARNSLNKNSILMEYLDLRTINKKVEKELETQACGTHADEIETSRMLYIAPEVVNMESARPESNPSKGPGGLTRDPNKNTGVYSKTGAWGDPTLATVEKGKVLTESLVDAIVAEIINFSGRDFKASPPREEYL